VNGSTRIRSGGQVFQGENHGRAPGFLRSRRTRYRAFMKVLLADLRALEYMLERGMFDTGPQRIGAEQELFLIDDAMRPAPVAMQVLQQAADPRLTTEIGKFNLEANLTPGQFSSSALSSLEREIEEVLGIARKAAESAGAGILLTGILPTIRLSDLWTISPRPLDIAS
jgi:hypothetical protein